jgi:hypothetical protein
MAHEPLMCKPMCKKGPHFDADICQLPAFVGDLRQHGSAIVRGLVSHHDIENTLTELNGLTAGQSTRRGDMYAARNLLATSSAVAVLAGSAALRSVVEALLGLGAFPVRGLLFDKVPAANWGVGWHQDQFIPVAQRKEVPGFTAWSVKRGVPHVRPPAHILERMVTLRIHLDDCDTTNGALKIIPESHRHGFLNEAQISELASQSAAVVCDAKRGDVLAMSPLLLHASAPAVNASHRRVIHIEYAAERLPSGLEWPQWR